MSPRLRADPDLDQVELFVVDGNNLLHAVRGSGDQGGMAWLLPRLADRLADGVRAVVVMDGHPTPGLSDRRPAVRGVTVRHAGSVTADDLIVGMLESRPYAERVRSMVISNDRELRDRARRAGVPSSPVERLVSWISGPPRPDAVPRGPVRIGQGRAPTSAPSHASHPGSPAAEDEREPWKPGRSATRKRGPAHRPPRRRPTG